MGKGIPPVERVASLTNSAASLVDGVGLMIRAVLASKCLMTRPAWG